KGSRARRCARRQCRKPVRLQRRAPGAVFGQGGRSGEGGARGSGEEMRGNETDFPSPLWEGVRVGGRSGLSIRSLWNGLSETTCQDSTRSKLSGFSPVCTTGPPPLTSPHEREGNDCVRSLRARHAR